MIYISCFDFPWKLRLRMLLGFNEKTLFNIILKWQFAQPLHSYNCIFVTMKLISFVLSVYFLVLNFSPCEDNEVVSDDIVTEIMQHPDDDLEIDLCSPFCHCECCHIYTTYFDQMDITSYSSDISTRVFLYVNGLEKDFNSSILQPPQV